MEQQSRTAHPHMSRDRPRHIVMDLSSVVLVAWINSLNAKAIRSQIAEIDTSSLTQFEVCLGEHAPSSLQPPSILLSAAGDSPLLSCLAAAWFPGGCG